MNKNATIIFPSTHVVFEGLKEKKENLDENEKECIQLIILEVLMLILIRITNYFIAIVHLPIKVSHFLADKFL